MPNESSDVEHLKFLCQKIVQAYRIRLSCMKERHGILQILVKDFQHSLNDKKLMLRLKSLLSREYKLFQAVAVDERDMQTGIRRALAGLRYYQKSIQSLNNLPYAHGKINSEALAELLEHLIQFLTQLQTDLSTVEQRMANESVFLDKKDRVSFEQFIESWNREIDENAKLIAHFKNVLDKNAGVIKTLPGMQTIAKGALKGAGIGAFAVVPAASIGMAFQGSIVMALLVMAAIASVFRNSSEELVYLHKDRELIGYLQKVKHI